MKTKNMVLLRSKSDPPDPPDPPDRHLTFTRPGPELDNCISKCKYTNIQEKLIKLVKLNELFLLMSCIDQTYYNPAFPELIDLK